MNISRSLCGFTPGDADGLRKAMGKKILEVLMKYKERFINGAKELHDFPEEKSGEMWDKILGFASYCFNKSHSACYGLIAYWTAFMKANYFPAFMTANLIYEMGNKDKMTLFVQELKARGISVLPPDINESGWEFTWTGEAVRFGFGGIKGVGEGAAEHIMEVREAGGPFTDLYELAERIDTRQVNKRVIEHLIKVGAFDSLHTNRLALVETIERAFARAQRLAKNAAQNQETLFATFEEDDSMREELRGYAEVDDWSEAQRLGFEKQLTGYWMSAHPIEEVSHIIRDHASHQANDLAKYPPGQIAIGAVVLAKRDIKTRSGKRMAVLQVQDLSGQFDAVLFPGRPNKRGQMEAGPYERFAAEIEADQVLLLRGQVDTRKRPAAQPTTNNEEPSADGNDEEEHVDQLPSLLVEEVIPVHLLTERLTSEIVITIDGTEDHSAAIAATKSLLSEHSGEIPVTFMVQTGNDVLLTLQAGERWTVYPTQDLIDQLRHIWGHVQTRHRQWTGVV